MSNDLLIKINADAANVTKAFKDIKDQTEDLESTLDKVALISGAAFAAFTAEIFFSVKAFEEANKQTILLSNALQNQGIFTEELKKSYEGYAEAVEAATGIDKDAIERAQGVAQGFLGQTKITKELTFAIADLGAHMGGDLTAAAEKIARTIGTGTNAFARQGLVIKQGATEAERYAQVLAFVQLKSGGLAEEMNKADGYAHALTTSFDELQKAIGAHFAPVVEATRRGFIAFFDTLSHNEALTQLIVAGLAAGVVVTGIVTAVALAVPAFLALSAAATAVGIGLNVAFLGIPVLIGLVVAAVTLLALNWDKSMAAVRAAATATVTLVTELFGGLGKVLLGAFTLDFPKVQAGLLQIGEGFKKAKDVAVGTYKEITAAQAVEGEKQNAQKKALADREAAIEAAHQANLRAIRKGEIDLIRLQNEFASAEIIALKTKEIATIKAIDGTRDGQEIAALKTRLGQIHALQEQSNKEEIERTAAFNKLRQDTKDTLQSKGIAVDSAIRDDRLAQIKATAQTEADVDRNLQETLLTQKIEQRNKELLDRRKYGQTVATINKALYSDEVQGAKSATDDLVQLQQSKNATLKEIGKVAAVANITISTAESAMNIYEGFSTIPIVGPALGVIGAAAAVAFGAERIGTVLGAAQGGLVEGGTAGRDSVPALLMPGELVVPRKNFNDVVGAVQGSGGGDNSAGMLAALQSIDGKFSNPQTTVIRGDVLTDESYIDALVRKISDAIQYRNGQIYGVTT